jgi:hypothetical protein
MVSADCEPTSLKTFGSSEPWWHFLVSNTSVALASFAVLAWPAASSARHGGSAAFATGGLGRNVDRAERADLVAYLETLH